MRTFFLGFAVVFCLCIPSFAWHYICTGEGATLSFDERIALGQPLLQFKYKNIYLVGIIEVEHLDNRDIKVSGLLNDPNYKWMHISLRSPAPEASKKSCHSFSTSIELDDGSGLVRETVEVNCTCSE